nr:DUF3039 domain-containing protein [Microbacterium barkeri]
MTLLEETVEETTAITEDGDHDRFAHYFRKNDLDAAWLFGEVITAACGKQNTPTRDFTKFPVCPSCKEIYERLPAGE